MVDLVGQYKKIKSEIDASILDVVATGQFIKGPAVGAFEEALGEYLNVNHVISCANGTDALQVALMALDLEIGAEVILPAFTYPATVEVVALLKLKPVLVDVDIDTFNMSIESLKQAITEKTKVIIAVHLFGQSANMEEIMTIANANNIKVIEDNAQATGTSAKGVDALIAKTGTIGHIGTTSFFPTKNLGCYGDGGAIFTTNKELAERIRMICNHGQEKKYYHSIIGVNSRLDSIQAAILIAKLGYLDQHTEKKNAIALLYDNAFREMSLIEIPKRASYSSHSFHQYTIKVKDQKRDSLKKHLNMQGIPSMVYYPLPIHQQKAYASIVSQATALNNSETLSEQVLSLPIHTELDTKEQEYIIEHVKSFFN